LKLLFKIIGQNPLVLVKHKSRHFLFKCVWVLQCNTLLYA